MSLLKLPGVGTDQQGLAEGIIKVEGGWTGGVRASGELACRLLMCARICTRIYHQQA